MDSNQIGVIQDIGMYAFVAVYVVCMCIWLLNIDDDSWN